MTNMNGESRPTQGKSSEGRFRVVLACEGVSPEAGPQAAIDVAEEFANRPWHHSVSCTWDGRALLLQAENDFDSDGVALADEFSDAVAASIDGGFGPIRVVSAVRL
jgi:hypothetical protein